MLKYLIVLLDTTSVPFCLCDNNCKEPQLIPLDVLKQAVLYSMKENLTLQFVWPGKELPDEYKPVISSIDHINIVPFSTPDNDSISVFNTFDIDEVHEESTVVVRTSLDEFISNGHKLHNVLTKANRINIVIKDIESFNDSKSEAYNKVLSGFIPVIAEEYKRRHFVQFNLLTDRIMLDQMNNCNAGSESLTLAPDGNLYICPAYYYDREEPLGTLSDFQIKNANLYDLKYAPICRQCDAWHCKRCIWLNKKLTREVNTPSRQQCVMAHIERNTARLLLQHFVDNGITIDNADIPEIDYIDPFDKLMEAKRLY